MIPTLITSNEKNADASGVPNNAEKPDDPRRVRKMGQLDEYNEDNE